MLMTILVAVALVGGGTLLLLRGADWFTDGATDLARELGVSTLLVGIVLAGLEPEEMLTAAIASGRGAAGIALGDIIGTNVTIVLAALGLAAWLTPLIIHPAVRRQAVIATLASVPPIIALYLGFIPRWVGVLLLALFVGYTLLLVRVDHQALARQTAAEQLEQDDEDADAPAPSRRTLLTLTVGGLVAMAAGGPLIVEGALRFTTALGLRQSAVGLTIVALGTAAEMFALAVAAARRHQADILVGGIIGSFAYNLLVTLGLAAVVRPLPVAPQFLQVGVPVMIAAHLVLLGLVFRGRMGRVTGALLMGGYGVYLVAVVVHG
ncbi:MAG: sodium:calcium antiporter [Ktedonobacterales bacterium]|nr:sodium:calcium antiporter [Ktedonobacterales bacterium]